MNHFLSDGSGCSECHKDIISANTKQQDEIIISKFMATGNFHNGTVFRRGARPQYWDYWCPVCANDEYSQNGLCEGWFSAQHGIILAGCVSCRCTKGKIQWTREQYGYKIKKELAKDQQYTFLNWETEYASPKAAQDKCSIHCSIHDHTFKSSWNKIQNGTRGGCCADNGFDTNKPAHVYVIKTDQFIGFGISNVIKKRLSEHRTNFRKHHVAISDIKTFYFENGLDALRIENKIKTEMNIIPQTIDGFKTEAVSLDDYELVLSYFK